MQCLTSCLLNLAESSRWCMCCAAGSIAMEVLQHLLHTESKPQGSCDMTPSRQLSTAPCGRHKGDRARPSAGFWHFLGVLAETGLAPSTTWNQGMWEHSHSIQTLTQPNKQTNHLYTQGNSLRGSWSLQPSLPARATWCTRSS